ncbi:MAG: HU family DNA-binding protein [Bacteroidales bacterium]|nr:HU family DNA-binding protein [Bacteroidales bacterium]
MKKTISRKQLAGIVSCITRVPKKDAELVITASCDVIMKQITKGHIIKINGFGTFESVWRKSKTGRDLSRGQSVHIPAHASPIFRPSTQFKNKVKNLIPKH